MTDKCIISIIVPVYNVGKYLRDCLDSLLGQVSVDASFYEIICVNDGSTDGCGEVIEEYANRDARIVIVTQENRGLSGARNTGISTARGEYIAFVDADDMVDVFFLTKVIPMLLKHSPDVLIGNYCKVPDSARFIPAKGTEHAEEDCYKDVSGRPVIQAWRIITRRDILIRHGLRFDERAVYAEDILFHELLYCYLDKERIYKTEFAWLLYRQRDSSISRRTDAFGLLRRLQGMLAVIDACIEHLSKNALEHEDIERIKDRICDSTAAACCYSLMIKSVNPFKIRRSLKERGLYPYENRKILWDKKRNRANVLMCYLRSPLIFDIAVLMKNLRIIKAV